MDTKFWLESLKGRDHLEVLGVAGRKILNFSLSIYSGRVRTGFIWFRQVGYWQAIVNTVMNTQVS
jgi:hypothetical protein